MKFTKAVTALLVTCLVSTPAVGTTLEEIQACVEANAPEVSATQTIVMRSTDRTGETSETRSRILWRRPEGEKARLLLQVIDPVVRRGSTLLAIQRGEEKADFYLYLPELRRSRKVSKKSLKGSMFGTDLSYEDFQRVQQMKEDSSVTLGEEVEYEGRKAYQLIAEPGEDSSYEKVVTLIDKERCIVLRSDYFESGDTPRKRLFSVPEKVTQEEFGWLPREVRIDDLQEKTSTSIVIEEFDHKAEVSEDDLSVENLGKTR